jgi:hypothetical protein
MTAANSCRSPIAAFMIPSFSAEFSPSATVPVGQQTRWLLAQRVGHSRHQFVKLEPGRLRMSLLAENTMNEVYTMEGVIGRRCCLTQEASQLYGFFTRRGLPRQISICLSLVWPPAYPKKCLEVVIKPFDNGWPEYDKLCTLGQGLK